MRRFRSCKGQRHHVGRWWTATTGAFVGYESWLERDRLVLLDFDRYTVGIVSQPFWLFWTTAEGKVRSHVPDYFARLAGSDWSVQTGAAGFEIWWVLGWRVRRLDPRPTRCRMAACC